MSTKVFNSASKLLQRSRIPSFPPHHTSYLKKEIASRISDRLYDIKRDFQHLLEYENPGFIREHIELEKCKLVSYTDTSKHLLDTAYLSSPPGLGSSILTTLDAPLPCPPNTYDAIISNLSLHWHNDLLASLSSIQSSLTPDGVFIGAMFGAETLYELRTSLQLSQTERQGGISPHISPMVDFKDVGGLLGRCGFNLTTVDLDEIVVTYPSIHELIGDLNAMGEGNAIAGSTGYLGRDVISAAGAVYNSVYGDSDGNIPATFQIGWKPSESQFKPVARGSAKRSMKELENNVSSEKQQKLIG